MTCRLSISRISKSLRNAALEWSLLLVAAIALFASVPLLAQTSTSRILGGITDQTGGAIAGATVTVTDTQRGTSRTLTTDDAGEYNAPNLIPGNYNVRAEAKGFKTIERQNLLLEVGQEARVDLTLQPGEQTEKVTVTEQLPLIETTNATLGGTLSNETINELPLNGRNYLNLLSLRPGVEQYAGGGAWTQASNGLRVEDIYWVIDGLDNLESNQGEPVINSPGTAGDAATILPIDAIQEFNEEENPKAEFGWKAGAVVNVGLKSGTNQLHGTAYGFGRSGALDAKNFFATSGPKSDLGLEQWGGTVGGHIIKDKLFYFAGFEEQRYSLGVPQPIVIPSTSPAAGPDVGLPAAEAALANAGAALNPLSMKLLPLFGTTSDPGGNVTSNFPVTNDSNNVIGKIDYNLSAHHTISGSYFFGNDNNISEDAPVTQPQFLSTFLLRTQALATRWIWTPSTNWVNEARFGFVRYTRPVQSVDHNVPTSSYGIDSGALVQNGLPTINVEGLTEIGAFQQWPGLLGPDNNFDFLDQLSYLRGKHSFKMGGEFRDAKIDNESYANGRGRFRFTQGVAIPAAPSIANPTALEDFLAGVPGQVFFIAGSPVRHIGINSEAGFVQDDYRVTSRLTVNLGLRWEYEGPLTEANNLMANWTPSQGFIQVGNQVSAPYNRNKDNFAPRFGLAWDVSGKGTTVVRAGANVAYDWLQAGVFDQAPNLQNAHTAGISKLPTGALFEVPGTGALQPGPGTIATKTASLSGGLLSLVNWNVGGPVLPATGAVACGDGLTPVAPGGPATIPVGKKLAPCPIFAVDQNLRTPYVVSWTATIQHAFSNALSLEVAYIGNHGGHLTGVIDINQINPQSPAELACGHCEANADRPYAAKYPDISFINYLTNPYISNYNGLQTTLTGRNYHGLSFVAGYTYAHALDDMSFSAFNFTPQDSRVPASQYANGDFDIRHRLTLSVTYNIPGIKSPGQLLEGWQLNSIVMLQGAAPWNAFDTGDDFSKTAENMDRWNFYGNPKDFSGSGTQPIPFFAWPNVPQSCINQATAIGALSALQSYGCYAKGGSYMIPPAFGTFGTMGRNIFRDTGFRNWDLSVFKNFKFRERYTAQFRAEFFNVLNRAIFANPYGSINGYGAGAGADPSNPSLFGCGCQTPDVAATNPILGSGGARSIQFGLKLGF